MTNAKIPLAPAPWQLSGRGCLFLFRMPLEAAAIPELLPRDIVGPYRGGLSALMLVDYESSDVGPYRELLFIPGRFAYRNTSYYGISRIWVSSEASVVNGQNNWGIPKELASFHIDRQGREERWSVARPDGTPFFATTVQSKWPRFPMHTSLLPFPLLQKWKGRFLQTNFKGRGWARLASMQTPVLDPSIFPDISAHKPLFGMAIEPFRIEFPVARELPSPLAVPQGRRDSLEVRS